MTWEKEKEYRKKKAAELSAEMERAIESLDRERFRKAFQTAMNYMKRSELITFRKRLIQKYSGR